MDKWKDAELSKMRVGGNRQAKDFLTSQPDWQVGSFRQQQIPDSVSRRPLNPDLSCFLNLPGINIKLKLCSNNNRTFPSKEVK